MNDGFVPSRCGLRYLHFLYMMHTLKNISEPLAKMGDEECVTNKMNYYYYYYYYYVTEYKQCIWNRIASDHHTTRHQPRSGQSECRINCFQVFLNCIAGSQQPNLAYGEEKFINVLYPYMFSLLCFIWNLS